MLIHRGHEVRFWEHLEHLGPLILVVLRLDRCKLELVSGRVIPRQLALKLNILVLGVKMVNFELLELVLVGELKIGDLVEFALPGGLIEGETAKGVGIFLDVGFRGEFLVKIEGAVRGAFWLYFVLLL